MYDRILVATDGSDAAVEAVEEAVELAAGQGAELHVINVVEMTAVEPMGPTTGVSVDSMEEVGQQAVAEAVERAQEAGVESVEGVTTRGVAHEEIVAYVEDQDIGLVVVGTHGRTGLDRLLLGSVAEKVVRLSPVPVLTVRSGSYTGGPKQ